MVKRLASLSTIELALLTGFSLLLAVLFTGSAVFSAQKSRIFVTTALPVNAEVVEVIKLAAAKSSSEISDGSELSENSKPVRNVPVFQYKVSGTVFESRVDYGEGRESDQGARAPASLRMPEYSVGDTTTIYYNPENPAEIRDVLTPQTVRGTTVLSTIGALGWLGFIVFGFSFLRSTGTMDGRQEHMAGVDTNCVFIALEGTAEKSQNARLIRLVCRWVHPETGVEWLLRSPSLHPTALPPNLELGVTLPCTVDFDDPVRHYIRLTESDLFANSFGSRLEAAA